MRILVTGGAGYIGSVVIDELVVAGREVTVIDDLSKGHRDAVNDRATFVDGSLADRELLDRTLDNIEAVIHLAASSLVGESVREPEKYYQNNVVNGRNLLEAMAAAGVKKIVFSSTAAVYGEPARQPVVETDELQPTSPYGATKLEFERELEKFRVSYGINYASLRYFNAAGASERRGERHEPETHLIPLVLSAALGEISHLDIYGDDYATRDGTCIRDYIHVTDLARAHILTLGILDERSAIYNLGCGGEGYSVREVIETASELTGLYIPVRIADRRAGDPAVLIASSDKITAELGWKPEFQDLRKIVSSAWKWMKTRPLGRTGRFAVNY